MTRASNEYERLVTAETFLWRSPGYHDYLWVKIVQTARGAELQFGQGAATELDDDPFVADPIKREDVGGLIQMLTDFRDGAI